MTIITKDPYADELLLNVEVLKSGLRIKRDAYADKLLDYTHDETDCPQFPVSEEAPKKIAPTDNKEEEI